MQNDKASLAREISPDERKLTKIQAKRLAALADVKVEEIESLTHAKLIDRLKWKVDPNLFLFRRVCGKVVKKDPITGIEYPVPYATVVVEDTDCHLISYFPKPWPWGWFFPFHCHREVLATTKTDACGNFCVWIPRFDIDWILEWRKRRICFPIIFRRPSIVDLLPKLPPEVVGPWPPIPGPDPGPLDVLRTLPPRVAEVIGGANMEKVIQQLTRAHSLTAFGAPNELREELSNVRAFDMELPPPLPNEFHEALAGDNIVAAKGASALDGIRSAVAMKLGLDPKTRELADFDIHRFIGPFYRCYDVFIPEWHFILDVPDITFRVTQDVNGDGVEENIYTEGYFDVRWDAGPLPNVKLVASSIAKESHVCGTPVVPCGNVPAILFAGLMPLTDLNFFNATTGYALRPNRPASGVTSESCPVSPNSSRSMAQTPFCQTLQLYGCVNVPGAAFYRILRSIDGGATFSAITGLSWNIYPIPNGAPVTISADQDGWYAVLANPNAFHPARMLLEWPTPSLEKSILKVEIGNNNKQPIGVSANVAIQTDNTVPTVTFNRLAWKFVSEPGSALRNLLGIPCPTIHRGATPHDIEVVFEVGVAAHHLRSACIGTSGCGSGVFAPQNHTGSSHWHTSVGNNAATLSERYVLSHTALEGAYSFGCTAFSRTMNPAGGDGGHLANWLYDPGYLYVTPSIGVAVVNRD